MGRQLVMTHSARMGGYGGTAGNLDQTPGQERDGRRGEAVQDDVLHLRPRDGRGGGATGDMAGGEDRHRGPTRVSAGDEGHGNRVGIYCV